MSSEEGEKSVKVQTNDPICKFDTYEEYLDTFVTEEDLFYLGNPELARDLYEFTDRGKDLLKRPELEERKEAARNGRQNISLDTKEICSRSMVDFPSRLLQELALREADIRNGRLETIVFIRDFNSRGQEISGYIDIGHRMRNEDWKQYFSGKKKLLPQPTDLSFYNWKTNVLRTNPSSSFEIVAEDSDGIGFKHRRDRKVIRVNPSLVDAGDGSTRTPIDSTDYSSVVLYDHMTRRKNF